jgi:hypothetical protein
LHGKPIVKTKDIMPEAPQFNLEKLNSAVAGKKTGAMSGFSTWRAKVAGGWLVIVSGLGGPSGVRGVAFYPDPDHTWDGGTMP